MYDMTIRLQTDGNKCLYEQIYEHIRQEIKEGKLLSGERLPSARSLACSLQVARSTVDNAYGQLVSEGYIEARPCKGYYVCSLEELFSMEEISSLKERQDQQNNRGIQGVQSDRAMHNRTAHSDVMLHEPGTYAVDFSPYEIDMSLFPFSVWKKITKNILTYANSELFSQGEAQGDYELRCTISRYLYSSRGVNCTPEQIIVGAGNDYLLLLLEKILGRHVRIAMENPTYKRAYRILKSFAYPIVTVNTDENGMKVKELEKTNADAVYVMPSHQFPTGAVMPIGRRTELLNWAAAAPGRYLIEDDYDSEFRYRGKPIPSLHASDAHGRVIYIGTFSKAIAPAIRISYMVLPGELLERYQKECYFYSCSVSRIDQQILNEFIRDGYFERYLNKMRKHYRGKHELLLECLKPFLKKFTVSGEYAGLHLLLTAKGSVTESELVELAAKNGVKVYGLSESLVEETSGGAAVLIGFGGLTDKEIIQGAELLNRSWLE